ncbi:MAG: hypothetical protein ACOVJ8_10550 [Sediminibacterium sp.]
MSGKTIYIITGAPNDRKSSTIRALTGVHNGKSFEVEINGITENVFVMTTSPNEVTSKVLPNGISPDQLLRLIKSLKKETKIILPIRSLGPLHNLPGAEEYIKILHNAGFTIAIVAMFNSSINLPTAVTGILVKDTQMTAANKLASKLRKLWSIS